LQDNKKLQDIDMRKDEFIAILAHELRSPLAPLQNSLKVLEISNDEKIRQQAHTVMSQQLCQISRLIADLMDVSRIAQNKIEISRETVSLSKIIESAINTSLPLLEQHQHKFSVQFLDNNIYVYADAVRLSQVFSNILNNAAKYTLPGGEISLLCKAEDENVIIKIKDNGLGIDKSSLPQIFEMFTQIDTSLERSHGGLGIGLAIVKNLVYLHDGDVEISSEGLGKGSEVIVTLPIIHPMAIPAEVKSEENPSAKTVLRIIVLDDNEASAQTMGWMLELMGHEYKLVFHADEFFEAASSFKPDVILMDIGLPGKNGYDLCKELRTIPEFKKTMIIAQTGWGQEKDKIRSKESGFDFHLVKPIDHKALEQILSEDRL